ncbi:MAG: cytochrome c [Bryobacteraceae bacterium]|jgi:mono/diheme cytochrome c family protein
MPRCSAGVLALAAMAALSCSQYPAGGPARLHNDMVDQPSFRAQEDPRLLPPGAIPARGWEMPLTLKAAQRDLRNPVPATASSLAYGGRLFDIYCAPCHGVSGRGDGPVAAKIVKPADLTAPKYISARDGFFYYVMRYGSGLMPAAYESVSADERWFVIHHIRALQVRP